MRRAYLVLTLLCLMATPAQTQPISATDRQETIDAIARLLEQRYVDPSAGAQLAAKLRLATAPWRDGEDGPAFARWLTAWLRDHSHDGHLAVDYSPTVIPPQGGEAAWSAPELERFYGPQVNHGVHRVEQLPGNIMVLDLRAFPPSAMGGDVIAAAMTLVAQGDALIIDLRANGGGMETVNLVAGYLLPPGSPLSGIYDRPSDQLTPQTSPATVPGRRFGATKPVYLLTSRRTFSAAEALAYDLQVLKRATIVGETTGGGANPFEYRRVHPHFALSLPEQRSINPITGTNWQDVGVRPDVPVPAAEAMTKALALARAKLTAEHRKPEQTAKATD